MGMFDGLFGGKDTRQKQLDAQEKQATDFVHHDTAAEKRQKQKDAEKAAAKKKASQSIQDWIDSGR